MRRFLLRRLLWFGLTLFAVVTLAFGLMRGVRGGPFDSERPLPAAIERNLRAAYHLDWPLWKQYLQYVGPVNLGERGPRWLGGDGSAPYGGLLALDLGVQRALGRERPAANGAHEHERDAGDDPEREREPQRAAREEARHRAPSAASRQRKNLGGCSSCRFSWKPSRRWLTRFCET